MNRLDLFRPRVKVPRLILKSSGLALRMYVDWMAF